MPVESITYREYADAVLDRAVVAAQQFKRLDQAAIDRIVKATF